MSLSSKNRILSWAFYDFANTIFSAIVLTVFFPLHITQLAGANWYLGVATTGAMVLAGLFIPMFGALSDVTGKTKTYLIRATLACSISVCFLAFSQSIPILIFIFLIACFFYHASLVFYNTLLPVVAEPSQQGWASGLGTGLGYLGVVLSLPAAHWIDQNLGRAYVFPAAGILFLLASLPLFIHVPERAVKMPRHFRWDLWRQEWKKILGLLAGLPAKPALLLFLAGNFFTVDAINSMIFWFLVYTREIYQPQQSDLIRLMMAVNASAFVMGLLTGRLTDRIGAMKTLLLSSGALALALILMAVTREFVHFAVLSLTLGAFALAGVWTAGRKLLVELSPKDQIGEYFGLYGLTTKISVLGSLLFSIIADTSGFRPALGALVFPAGIGFLFLSACSRLRKLPGPH